MVARVILHKLPSIWYIDFLVKVLLSVLNVRQGQLFAYQVLLIFIFSGIICFEEFVEGSMVARLSCLCSFHKGKHQVQNNAPLILFFVTVCLSSWLQRGNGCPIHMRDQ